MPSLRQCRPMTGPDHAVGTPAVPLGPFVSHYAGSRMRDVPPGQHAGLPSRHLDLIVSLARPIEIARMPGAQSPGSVPGLRRRPAAGAGTRAPWRRAGLPARVPEAWRGPRAARCQRPRAGLAGRPPRGHQRRDVRRAHGTARCRAHLAAPFRGGRPSAAGTASADRTA